MDSSLLEEDLERIARTALLIAPDRALHGPRGAPALTRVGGSLTSLRTRTPATTAGLFSCFVVVAPDSLSLRATVLRLAQFVPK
jgi:hypothetical protein